MEELKVLDYSNVFIASYFTNDQQCSHPNREHTLIYLCSGELEIEQYGKCTLLREGECAFMRRDNRMILRKRVREGVPYRSVVLKFSRNFFIRRWIRIGFLGTHGERRAACICCLPAVRISGVFSSRSCPISIQG